MEENQRTSSVEVANNFDDIFKSVEDVKQQDAIPTPKEEVAPTVQEQLKIAEVKIVEEVAPQVIKPTQYKQRLSQLIEDGFITDVAIGITNDKGEKENIFLSELKNVDKETYQTVLAQYKEATDKENKEKYISTDGIDDVTKNLIEIRKNKGDITDLIKNNVSAIDQWQDTKENLTDNEQLQMNVIAWDLKNKGLTDRVIEAQIKDYADNLQLDTEAEKIVDANLLAHKGEIENKKNQQIQRAEAEREAQKQTKKDVTARYKELGVAEHLQKVFIKNATDFDQSGMTNTEKLFFESTRTAEDLAEVTFFLSNREAYKTWVASAPVLKATTQGLKPLFEINLKSSKPAKQSAVTASEHYDEVFGNQ